MKTTSRTLRAVAPDNENGSLSRGEEAYQKMREAIQSGALRPGTRLREVELAEWLGSSRTPVREALNRLQTEGLVVHEPRRGMIIAELDHSMVSELYFMREVLEGTAARLAARHASDVEIAMLREIAERDRQLDDPVKLARNNRMFHETLYRAAHNRYLLKTLSLLQESLALLGPTTLALPGRAGTAYEEHNALVGAIERHDADAAEELSRAHIRSAHRARMKIMFEQLDDEER
ncbi:MAG TPA: GntR family transcriptional regulator [Noviherbaspirillum sp.]|nr:GntR family transcriptional regulator [Noviherbaspirillum sp.]